MKRQFFNIPTAAPPLPKLPDQPEPAAVFNTGPADIEQLAAETNAAIISGTSRKPYYQQIQVSIPATSARPVNLPVIPDRIYFYTTVAFTLPLLIGPDQGFLPLPAGTYICLPGTSKVYWIANPNAAAVTVTLVAIRDLPEFEMGGVGAGAGAPGALAQNVVIGNATPSAVSVLTPNDTVSPALALTVFAELGIFNGATFERVRTPSVFKPLSAVVITAETTIWTPAAGKKFRLMGFQLTQGVVTGAVTLRDNTAGSTIYIIPPHTIAVSIPTVNLGNGILSAAANNVLTAQGASTETLTGTIWGMEE